MNIKRLKIVIIPAIISLISLLFLIYFSNGSSSIGQLSYSKFYSDIALNKISTVFLTNSDKMQVNYKDGTKFLVENPRSQNLKETLLKEGINVTEKSPSSTPYLVSTIFFICSLTITAIALVKSSDIKAKAFKGVDALSAKKVTSSSTSFEDIAGIGEIKESIQDIINFLKDGEKYKSYGARIPKGIILYGEPGTGKTLLAKAVAKEADVPFFAMSGSDFVQVYVGVGASRIRQLFKKARECGKAVIFIDEIDAIGKSRDNSKNGGSDEKDQTLNALLTEMSGFNESDGIIVMAATNRLDMLDSALLRPGRFDRHIEVPLPDLSAREEIINLYLKNKRTADINIHDWAKKTAYFSGAKLESLINESAILACKDNSPYIKETHLDKAFSIVLAGYEKSNLDSYGILDRKITAFHEAGHALVSFLVLPMEKISKITILPTTKGAGGYTHTIPDDSLYKNKDYIMKRLMVLLGGRAAEEIIFGEDYVTTGAYSDLKQSTSLASNMILEYGMGKSLGLLNFNQLSSLGINIDNNTFIEIRDLVENIYSKTKNILLENSDKLHMLSNKLLEEETLDYNKINSYLQN